MFGAEPIEVFILGAGGHGSELSSYIRDIAASGTPVKVAGFIDDHKPESPFAGSRILGGFDALEKTLSKSPRRTFHYITAVGDDKIRAELVAKVEKLAAKNIKPWTLRHPAASVGHEVEIGEGTCLAPGSIVTTRVSIGKHCILNVNASVSHDCLIGDFVNINPRVAVCGNVRIGNGSYIGAGATVIDKVTIGEWTVIGAGATVIANIPPHVTAVGVPANVIKSH
jgi:sugar O-acyltransferase (sialic acid O-acetyltransferase NeuD family)